MKQTWCNGVSQGLLQDVKSNKALSKGILKQSWYLGVPLGLVLDVQSSRAFFKGTNETELVLLGVPWPFTGFTEQ